MNMGGLHSYFFAGGVCSDIKTSDLTGKTVIVTGASSGSLGFATAKIFVELKAKVIVTATSESGAKKAAEELGDDVIGHALNLQDVESIKAFVSFVEEKCEAVDILVNNAGIHLDLFKQWKEAHLSPAGIELMWHTNYLGTFYLTELMLPLLLKSAKDGGNLPRIVNVGSWVHRLGNKNIIFETLETKGKVNSANGKYNSWKAYGQSKLAVIMFTKQLAKLMEGKINCYYLHPGGVFTNVADKGLEGNKWFLAFRSWLKSVEAFILKSPEEGSQTTLYCAIADQDKLVSGGYYVDCKLYKSSKDSYDEQVAADLYAKTKETLGLE